MLKLIRIYNNLFNLLNKSKNKYKTIKLIKPR